jgi:SsrA-binding protein
MQFITKNKRAYFDYEIEKEYEAGIILKWHEVKSIKTSHVNIQDAAIVLENRELWIYNMDIPLYEKTSPVLVPHYRQKWKRKLLLNKYEITKIAAALDKPWMVALALEVFVNKWGFIKLKIGIGRLHKKVEKKQIIKERDIKKQMDRDVRSL